MTATGYAMYWHTMSVYGKNPAPPVVDALIKDMLTEMTNKTMGRLFIGPPQIQLTSHGGALYVSVTAALDAAPTPEPGP